MVKPRLIQPSHAVICRPEVWLRFEKEMSDQRVSLSTPTTSCLLNIFDNKFESSSAGGPDSCVSPGIVFSQAGVEG